MNLVGLACTKIIRDKKSKKFTRIHAQIFQSLFKFHEMYLDEICEFLSIEEQEASKVLEEFHKLKLVEKEFIKYRLKEPIEAVHWLVSRK